MTNSDSLFPAVFIDRDGVINEERHYVHRVEDFELIQGTIEGLMLLRDAGFKLIVVTNQAGIARGYYSESALNELHDHLKKILAKNSIILDAIYYCPHHPAGTIPSLAIECDCRKPAPGMIFQAAHELKLDLSRSYLIGDKLSDIQAGRNAGVGQTVAVLSGHPINTECYEQSDFVAANLFEAADLITR